MSGILPPPASGEAGRGGEGRLAEGERGGGGQAAALDLETPGRAPPTPVLSSAPTRASPPLGRGRQNGAVSRETLVNAGLILILGLCWGLNWPAVRLALDGFPPFTFRALGFGGAALLMGLALALKRVRPSVPRTHWLRLLAVGCFSVVAYNMFSAFAQLTASTTRSAVLSYTMPVWTVVFARVVVGERFDARRIVGLGLGVAGLVALGEPILQSGQFTIGLVYALMSAIVWALGNVLMKRFPIDAPPLVFTFWQLILGAVISIALMLVIEGWPRHLTDHPSAWGALAYNVVIGQAVATTLWFTILSRMPAGIAAIGSLLVPGIGVIGATLILGERPTGADWLGLVLIVGASATVLVRLTPASTLPAPEAGIMPVPNRRGAQDERTT